MRPYPWLRIVKDDLLGIGWRVKHVNPYFALVFNMKRSRYEVHDFHPKVHPDHTLLMVVMEEDGGYRHPDSRVITNLNELVAAANAQDAMDAIANRRERKWDKEMDEIGYGLAEAIKWAGKSVVPSVAWRERSGR
jgi:hypothetical protein